MGVWKGSYSSDKQLELIKQLNTLKGKGIEIKVLLSPFYFKFNDSFISNSSSETLDAFKGWKLLWEKKSVFKTIDVSGDISVKLPQTIDFWDDGVHLNKFGSASLLEMFRGDLEPLD